MAPRFKVSSLERTLARVSCLFGERVRPLAGGSRMFPVSGTVRQLDTSEVEAGRYSHRGQRAYATAANRDHPILIYAYSHGVGIQFPADRAALPGRSQLHVHRREELPELPGVERFPEGPRGVLSGLLQADGTVGDGTGAGEFGTRELGRLQVQGEQLEAQGESYGRLKDEGAGVVRGDRSASAAGGRSGRGGGSVPTRSGRGMSCPRTCATRSSG